MWLFIATSQVYFIAVFMSGNKSKTPSGACYRCSPHNLASMHIFVTESVRGRSLFTGLDLSTSLRISQERGELSANSCSHHAGCSIRTRSCT